MANCWALDDNNWDMFVDSSGEIGRVVGVDEVRQHIKERIWFFYEEWFLDRDAGLPWFQEIFKKPEKKALADAYLKKEIIDTDGVEELLSFDSRFDYAKRAYQIISFAVKTKYGLLEEKL